MTLKLMQSVILICCAQGRDRVICVGENLNRFVSLRVITLDNETKIGLKSLVVDNHK